MGKHTYIQVKLEDFLLYQEKYGHDRLDKWYRISTPSKQKLIHKIFNGWDSIYEEEIFNGIETIYQISNIDDSYLLKFNSNSGEEYRFDLLKEPNTNIYHLGFSLSEVASSDYSNLTNKNESIDVFNRLIWILKDITPKLNIDEYCIGATNNPKKDRIYEYMMKFVSGWEKRPTDQYDLGWALYFKI